MPSADVDMFFDDRNTARPTRGRFRYQDECVALRCIPNLASEGITAVLVEWSTDYVAVPADGDPELVSVKHREPPLGAWPLSDLGPVLADLHRVWRAMDERCSCAFASNAAPSRKAHEELGAKLNRYIKAEPDELARFLNVTTLPRLPLPSRVDITAVGIRDMAGALSVLGRDPQFAEACYLTLVGRIASVATEEPDTPEQRIAKLTGSLREVRDRDRPRPGDQTLRIADLRELVLATERARARTVLPPLRATVHSRAPAPRVVVLGGDRLLLPRAAADRDAPHGSYRELRTNARGDSGAGARRRLTRLTVTRDSTESARRRAEIAAEVELHALITDLPRVFARVDQDTVLMFATTLPDARPLLTEYGQPPYPGIVLDSVLAALPHLAATLGRFHDSGRAHRALDLEGLLVHGDRMWLRDAGLATTAPAPGEGPTDYRAPEQQRPLVMPIGPATDAYQVAAIVYHLATGQPPGNDPPPPCVLRPGLAPGLDEPLLSALREDPASRSSLAGLVSGLRAVRHGGGTTRC
ncbi:hypothetical protein [Actinoplanes sp. NPDC089786]|uniref:hypothetical protein n=1 Tax=Actinoplanes sp. NPDC089786 TaxID=3155185 RepID=UPI003448D706